MSVVEASDPGGLVGVGPPPARARRFPSGGRRNPLEALPAAAYEAPIWRSPSILGPTFLVNDPAGLKRVLLDNVANYPKTPLERRIFRALFGDGLLSSDGETWRTHRRIMAPSFDPRSVAGYAATMAEAASAFGDSWAGLDDGTEVDVSEQMTGLTLEIISRTMFSADAAGMTGTTGLALQQSQEAAFDFNLLDILPVIGPMRLAAKERIMGEMFAPMDGALARLIEARRTDPGRLDLLGRLVAALDEDTGARLTPREVRDEVLTIFVAGHETTASAMTFVWYVLSLMPQWEARLHEELDAVLGGRAPGEADLPGLVLARRIIEECMRLYPPAPGLSARVALAADEIAGQKIKAGSTILISPWVLHRHRTLWDRPERFDPDRFGAEPAASRPRFAYLPFGGGPRVCIGQVLAMTEATLILASLAQRFRLRLRPGYRVEIQQRVTIRPRGGLPMRVERRRPARV
ncbi:MAG TPA: cytochrome P450 [Caulobacteraceae bacterium]|nr:cytochrome P450 [Caulobacteraceae bacterium]